MTDELRCEIRSAYKAGYPIATIAARLRLSYETVHLAVRRDHECRRCT